MKKRHKYILGVTGAAFLLVFMILAYPTDNLSESPRSIKGIFQDEIGSGRVSEYGGDLEIGPSCSQACRSHKDCSPGRVCSDNCCVVPRICGDGVVNQFDEVCDGGDLDGAECSDFNGYNTGELGCLDDCSGYDLSNCEIDVVELDPQLLSYLFNIGDYFHLVKRDGYLYGLSPRGLSILDDSTSSMQMVYSPFTGDVKGGELDVNEDETIAIIVDQFFFNPSPFPKVSLIDISDKENPVTTYTISERFYAVDIHDNFAYFAGKGQVWDLSNLENPQKSSLLGLDARDVEYSNGYLYLLDKTKTEFSVYDVSTPLQPILINTYQVPDHYNTPSIVFKIDPYRNLLFFVKSNSNEGISVLDIADPNNIQYLTTIPFSGDISRNLDFILTEKGKSILIFSHGNYPVAFIDVTDIYNTIFLSDIFTDGQATSAFYTYGLNLGYASRPVGGGIFLEYFNIFDNEIKSEFDVDGSSVFRGYVKDKNLDIFSTPDRTIMSSSFSCFGQPDGIDCSDSLFCNGVETCLSGECVSSGSVCNENERCNEIDNSCIVLDIVCGNNVCESGENCLSCESDCGVCNSPEFTEDSPHPSDTVTSSFDMGLRTNNFNDHYSFIKQDNDLLGWYEFENGAVLQDSSGLGRDLTFSFDPQTSDGDPTGVGEYGGGGTIERANLEEFILPETMFDDSFSVSGWYSINGDPNDGFALFSMNELCSNNLIFVGTDGSEGRFKSLARLENGQVIQARGFNDFAIVNGFTHFAATFNKDVGLKTYINGELIAFEPSTGLGLFEESCQPIIGSDINNFMTGTVDEILIFNRALSDDEVFSLFDSKPERFYFSLNSNFQSFTTGNSPVKAIDCNDGKCFVAVGVQPSTVNNNYLFDVSDPANVLVLDTISDPDVQSINDAVYVGDYAYVIEGNVDRNLKVIDLSDTSDIEIVFSESINGARNIDYGNGMVFISAGPVESKVYVYGLTNPSQPNFLREINIDNPRDVEFDFSRNLLFVADYGYGIRIIDASNPSSFPIIGSAPATTNFYDRVDFLTYSESQEILYARSISAGRTTFFDVSNENSPTELGSSGFSGLNSFKAKDNYLFLTTNDRLKIYDMINPSSPQLSHNLDGVSGELFIDDNYAYVGGGSNKMVIYSLY